MKNELIALFGDQLRKFTGLSRKQRLCVLYFCMSFGALLSVFFIHLENIKSLDPLLYSQLTHQKYIRTK
ncbi:hypothetical protein QR305_03961 [Bacteroides finegoldii]|uniref:Uncharacterized protein n=1 Tax=Bacteroides finegoldii CL09T03C10 TaxID=997888 RepID=K5CI05_9BACE|nr:hypothetical protein HMPREF1057_02892 [Bacteroides finegoldii CL09T03C10]